MVLSGIANDKSHRKATSSRAIVQYYKGNVSPPHFTTFTAMRKSIKAGKVKERRENRAM